MSAKDARGVAGRAGAAKHGSAATSAKSGQPNKSGRAGKKGAPGKRGAEARPSTASVAAERAAAQERAKARRVENQRALTEHFATARRGTWIVWLSWIATLVFSMPTIIATVTNDTATRHGAAYVSLALFAIGMIVFPVALWFGAQRSRSDDMTMAGWWFLSGSAPSDIRWQLWASLALQTIVSITCAAIRFETSIAFGVLVPTLGLSLLGLWGSLYGYFPKREFLR